MVTVDGSILRAIAARLAASTFDVAAGLREDELDGFLKAHYQQQSQGGHPGGVYIGQGSLDDLGLKYSYSIGSPVTIALAPLSNAQFSRVMQSWMSTVPEIDSFGTPQAGVPTLTDVPPPNVQLQAPSITLSVSATDGSINPPATLTFSMTATGFISVTSSGGQAVVTIVPIDIRLDNPGTFQAALSALISALGFRDNAPPDSDCVSLKKLILHIVNSVIAPKLSSFVKEFHFPVPISLFDGVLITSVGLDVVNKLLVILANVSKSNAVTAHLDVFAISPSDAKTRANDATTYAQEEHAKLIAGGAGGVPPVTVLQDAITYPNRGIFLLMRQSFFQTLADALLVTSASNQGSSGGTIFYRWWWSMRTWNPITAIAGNGLAVSVDVQGSAGAEVGIHTHCGDISAGVSASASATPARADTVFSFQNQSRELWMSLALRPFTVNWTIGDLPWPLNKVIAALLDLFTDLGIQFIVAFGLRWKRKLTNVPDVFPGTQLTYDLSLDQNVIADPGTGALLVAGTITFKP